jgi:hypothetical protein
MSALSYRRKMQTQMENSEDQFCESFESKEGRTDLRISKENKEVAF